MAKPTLQQSLAVENLCQRWLETAKAEYGRSSGINTRADVGAKYFHLVIGTSSAFLVDIETGIIYGNKGWLKVDRKKIIGNAYDPAFNAAALVRDRFRYGRFENAPDGSLRQQIVRR